MPVRPPVFAGQGRRGPAYLLRIAWPTFVRDPVPSAAGAVVAGSAGAAPVPLRLTADLSDAAARDLDRQRAALVARAASRAAAKYWATRAARRKGGEVGGAMVGAATSLLERADTRSWHLLPGTIGAARLSLPAGTHEIAVELPGGAPGLPPVRVPLGSVTVRPGRVTLLSTRRFDGHAATVAGRARGVI
jgi:hypothetical protein